MAKKATQMLREAVALARLRRTDLALARVHEAGEWAVRQGQVNLISQAASLWDALGGAPAVSERWREEASLIRSVRRARPGYWRS